MSGKGYGPTRTDAQVRAVRMTASTSLKLNLFRKIERESVLEQVRCPYCQRSVAVNDLQIHEVKSMM